MSKKFPVYTAVDLLEWLHVAPVEGDDVQAEYLARATEVVNALGTDDVQKAQMMRVLWDSCSRMSVGQQLESVYSALGTSDLDEMRRMKRLWDWYCSNEPWDHCTVVDLVNGDDAPLKADTSDDEK